MLVKIVYNTVYVVNLEGLVTREPVEMKMCQGNINVTSFIFIYLN